MIGNESVRRFKEIYTALFNDRSFFESSLPLKFTALAAVEGSGAPEQLASRIREGAAALKAAVKWYARMPESIRLAVSTLLILNRDTPQDFIAENKRVEKMMRELRVRRGHAYECIAVLVMRTRNGLKPITATQIERFKVIHGHMQSYHPWITGSDDYPLCAMLATHPGNPEEMVDQIENIYQGLRREGFSRGNPLQDVANTLYMSRVSADRIVRRFSALAAAFKQSGVIIFTLDYEAIGLLTYLDQEPQRVIDLVATIREKLSDLKQRPDASLSFNLACSLAFLELARESENSLQLVQLKALRDMQAIVVGQQSAG